jgi:hypothetical protein
MAKFLGFSNEEIENNRKIIKQEIIKKWEDSGLLDGLENMDRTDLCQLYGGEASQLISETQTKSGFKPKNKIKKHKLWK